MINIEIMINDEADEVIKKLFKSLKSSYKSDMESMNGSRIVFASVHLLFYNKSESWWIIYRFSLLDEKQKKQ